VDNIVAQRNRLNDGTYDLSLEVRDSAYFNVYENADKTCGEAFLRDYLSSNADDANCEDIEVRYNKNRHIVNIKAKLNYDNSEHKEPKNRHKLM